jgi:N,N'-diacetyllegionaminate synthase
VNIKISNKSIGDKFPTFTIAEAGINHNGNVKLAKKLIVKAKECGADSVKFQTFTADDLTTESSIYYKLFKKLELQDYEYEELSDYAKSNKIIFLSTPFSKNAVKLLSKIKIPAFKIASGDLTDFPLLEYIAKKNKPILLSTGMANIEEVNQAIKIIESQNNKKIIILHSVSGYPYPVNEANLKAIQTLSKNFHYDVGFSDNGNDQLIPLLAVSMGAKVIEKHFTLNKKMKGPDHAISADPVELKNLIKQIRLIEGIMGDGIKKCQKSELLTRKNARKSITLLQNLQKNSKLKENIVGVKRPGTGIEPKFMKKIIGKKVSRNLHVGRTLQWNDLTI